MCEFLYAHRHSLTPRSALGEERDQSPWNRFAKGWGAIQNSQQRPAWDPICREQSQQTAVLCPRVFAGTRAYCNRSPAHSTVVLAADGQGVGADFDALSAHAAGPSLRYPIARATSMALAMSRSAYTWVTSAVLWPRMIWAASRPKSRRISVAAVCRS